MKKVTVLALLVLGCFCTKLHATERMYGLVGLGYADAEIGANGIAAKEMSYRLALGHQFHRQWYVELGYQRLVDDEGDGFASGLTAHALSISALGKAANRSGELFYRLGIANVDLKGQSLADEQGVCEFGLVIATVEEVGSACGFDEGVLAGVVGLGFDMHLGLNTMLRFEGEYMLGEDEYSNSALYIGFRYNFN